ncbi:uncharacterized protein LOC141595163 [Silene latifolia]|uniref:uncharacterized protein LOC141595163 n=1 Tax=Silene latifolia TaxID=37657 RepID=UPI003D78AF42
MICKVKNLLKAGYVNNKWSTGNGVYTIKAGYQWLQGTLPKVAWYPLVWNRFNVPKHSFIAWLCVRQRLLTKDKLQAFVVVNDGLCELCKIGDETHMHLFYHCPFSSSCWQLLKDWLNVPLPGQDIINWCVKWRCRSLLKKHVVFAVVVVVLYSIWQCKNLCRLEQWVKAPIVVVQEVQSSVKQCYLSRNWPTRFQQNYIF